LAPQVEITTSCEFVNEVRTAYAVNISTFKTQGESLERQLVKMGEKVGLFINGGDQKIECEIQKFDYKSKGVSKSRAET
jgi:hypothetical protein